MDGARRGTGGGSIGARFHTLVFAAYPVILVSAANAGVLPFDTTSVVRSLAVSLGGAVALLLILKPVFRDSSARAACLSFFFIACNLYALLGGFIARVAGPGLYLLASALVAMFVTRPWRSRPRKSTALNLAAGALLAANAFGVARTTRWNQSWRPAADAMIDGVATSSEKPPSGPRRDIYYVILDAFGRPDVLKDLYGVDLGPFVKALESRGFAVPAASRTNYSQTYLSLGSSLNLSYLDAVAKTEGDAIDRRPMDYLIQHNALMTLARRAGYRIIAIGSDYSATESLATSDECLCEQYGLSEFEIAALGLTPLRGLPLDRWTYDAHRRKIEASFRHLADAAREPGPKLVFAHVISPHPPFVFGPDGRPGANGSRAFSFQDGNNFPGTREQYVAGYAGQVQYVVKRVLAAVDAILLQPGPTPAIVLQGDHGPGSMWNWSDLDHANVRERMAIFAAYRLPGASMPSVSSDVTPVNGMRALANRYLGTALTPLRNLSFASTWEHPYRFERVDSTRVLADAARPAAHVRGCCPSDR